MGSAGGGSSGRDQVAHKDQGLARRDRASGAPVSVGETRWNDQLAAAADFHSLHALVPADDDLPDAELELERSAPAPASVEFLARRERDPDIVDLDHVALLRHGAITFPDIRDLQVGWRLAAGEVDLGLVDAHTRVFPSSFLTAGGLGPGKYRGALPFGRRLPLAQGLAAAVPSTAAPANKATNAPVTR